MPQADDALDSCIILNQLDLHAMINKYSFILFFIAHKLTSQTLLSYNGFHLALCADTSAFVHH